MLHAALAMLAVAVTVWMGLADRLATRARVSVVPVMESSDCFGCTATPVDGPNDIPVTDNGIQIWNDDPSVGIDATVGLKNGSCSVVVDPSTGAPVCGPDANCQMSCHYRLIVPSSVQETGAIRDDQSPFCNWSMVADPFGAATLTAGTIPELTTCGITWWRTIEFYKQASNCSTGTKFAKVKFSTQCGTCSFNQVVAAQVHDMNIACVGEGGPITLSALNQPVSGETFHAVAQGLDDSGLAVLVMGDGLTHVPLNLIDVAGLSTCVLFVFPAVIEPKSVLNGVAEVAVELPGESAYVGTNWYIQFGQYRFDGEGVPIELASSNALNLTIGHE